MRRLFLVMILFVGFIASAGAQESPSRVAETSKSFKGFYDDAGVEVTKVNVYSPKQLLDRQERIRQVLAAVGMDLARVNGAVGSIQGSSQRATNFSFQGTYAPLVPGPEKNSTTTVTKYDNLGNVESVETTAKSDTDRAQSSASIPGSEASKLMDVSAPTLGLSPQDLLDAQLELETYKTMLSYAGSGLAYQNRRYLLASFDVDIQPRSQHKGKAVEVFLEVEDKDRIVVDRHFPINRTYNVLEVVENRSDVGLGIVLWPISLGGRGGSAEKTAYLVKDYEVESFGGTDSSFGWRIRPVLNKKFVKPGKRTFYALLSIDMGDPKVEENASALLAAERRLEALGIGAADTPNEPRLQQTLKEKIGKLQSEKQKLEKTISSEQRSLSAPDQIPDSMKFQVRTRWVSLNGKQGVVKSVSAASAPHVVELRNPLSGKPLAPDFIPAGGSAVQINKTEFQVHVPCYNVGEFPEVYIGNKDVGDLTVVKYYPLLMSPEDDRDQKVLGQLSNLRWVIFTVGPDYLKKSALLTIRTDWGSATQPLSYVLGEDDFKPPSASPKVAAVGFASSSPGKAVLRVDGDDLEEDTLVTVAGQMFKKGAPGFEFVSKHLILIQVPLSNTSGEPGGRYSPSRVEVYSKKGTRLWSQIATK